MVELFMKYNPDTTTKNKAGRSPLDFAKQVGNDKLVNLLEK
ncbi:ankyrin repeat domain-containing protein [Bacillus sp. X1(2014)]|nr:ankyrin repeat domain-containing protein [Bacillus sp. X1(2014)]